MKRFFTVLTLMAMVVATWATPASAKKSDVEEAIDDGDAGVQLLTETAATITRGDDVWIMLNWTAYGGVFDAVEDFQVRLRKNPPNHVSVDYPVNTADHTSTWDNDVLTVGEVDYTALHVVVGDQYGKNEVKLKLEATYSVDGETFEQRFDLEIPVVSFEGDPIEQVTRDWGTASVGSVGWFEVGFVGHAPAVTDFSVVLSEPGGALLTYPQGDHTSLHFDDVLQDRETDVVRVYLATDAMVPGTYEFDVTSTYTYDGDRLTEVGTVTLEITAP